MRTIVDIEIHSKYSRAVSPQMIPENIARWAVIKGVDIVGTGDFTHPVWFKDLKNKLEPSGSGLFGLKKEFVDLTDKYSSDSLKKVKFILSGEVSCIYSEGGRVRKIHHLVFAPSFEAAEKINTQLSLIGNIKSDGRPILGLNSKRLIQIIKEASPDAYLIPAHVWTPWFGIFGSKSGFNSLEECFGDYLKYIIAVETGLSSDPAMNWRLPFLQNLAIISSSDAHSLSNIAREATLFDLAEPNYFEIFDALKTKDKRFIGTIEFFPEEGMYHFDGHRDCGVCVSPEESKKNKNLCPKCHRPFTIGVMNRVEELADKPFGFKPAGALPYYSLIGLEKIIGDVLGVGRQSKKVEKEYFNLIEKLGSELGILLDVSKEELIKVAGNEIAEGIMRVREGRVKIDPGCDGQYGKIKIFEPGELSEISAQSSLF